MLDVLLVAVAILTAGILVFWPRLSRSESWAATLTPLASIMGSGFLVSAPLLSHEVGVLALPSMAILLVLAFFIGGVMRFNIRHFEPVEKSEVGAAQLLAHASRLVLAAAYFVSITYYLQLLAAFALELLELEGQLAPEWVTSALLLLIAGIGMWRGLAILERVEKYAVSLNLAVVGALLLALLIHNGQLVSEGSWALPDIDSTLDPHALRVLLGLLIVVQGFETSRYLGERHSAEIRIRTMRTAQLASTLIYLLFLGLATVLFRDGLGADVTAIILMVTPVALVLPLMLSIAAIGSQFSAAVADTAGAGGLVEDLTDGRLTSRTVYLLILAVTVALTWETDVNEIIAYASRAFALYYTLQCLVALCVCWKQQRSLPRNMRLLGYSLLSTLCLTVFLFGLPAE